MPMSKVEFVNDDLESNGSENIYAFPNIEDYSIHTYDESSDGTTSLSENSEVTNGSSRGSITDSIRKFFHRDKKLTSEVVDDPAGSFSVFRHHRKKKNKNLSSGSSLDSQFAQGTHLQDEHHPPPERDGTSDDDRDELFEKGVEDGYNESPLTPLEHGANGKQYVTARIDFSRFFYDSWTLLTGNEITLEALGNKKPDEYLLTCLITLQKEYEIIRNQNVEYKEELLQRTTKMEALKNSNQRKIKKLKDSYEETIEMYMKKLEISKEVNEKELDQGMSDFKSLNAGLEMKSRELEETNQELQMKTEVLEEKVTNLTQVLSNVSRRLTESDERGEKYQETLYATKEKFNEIQTEIERSYHAIEQLKTKHDYQRNKLSIYRKELLSYKRLTDFFESCLRESLSFMGYLLEAFKDKSKDDYLVELNSYFVQMNKIIDLKREFIASANETKFQEAEELLYNFYTVAAKTKFVEPLLMRLETAERSVTFLTNQLGESKKKLSDLKAHIKKKHENSYNHRTLTSVNHSEL